MFIEVEDAPSITFIYLSNQRISNSVTGMSDKRKPVGMLNQAR